MVCSVSSPSAEARLSFRWLALGERSDDLIAMRCAIYGGELAWVGQGDASFAWDAYDRVSRALLVRDAGRLVASGGLMAEHDGPLEVSDLVDWKIALPPELRGAPAAEWSRVMIDRPWRGSGLFRRMYEEAREEAKRRGARLLAGASRRRALPALRAARLHLSRSALPLQLLRRVARVLPRISGDRVTESARPRPKRARKRSLHLRSATASIARVRRYYDATIAHEAQRLEENAYRRLERDMTLRTIVRHVPDGARILDVGGGPGTYLEPLARRGFDPWLCDLSDANVAVARERATALGLSDVERRVRQSDATNLMHYARASFDAALALGPFYHLLNETARRRALSEIVRVVKPGGTIVLAVLPRLHPLRYLLREATAEAFRVLDGIDWDALLVTGRFEHHEEFFTDAYLTDLAEFRAMLRRAQCRVIDTLSAESFCAFMDVPLCEWATSEEKYAKLLDLVDKTARYPEQIASAEHVLVVARKPGFLREKPASTSNPDGKVSRSVLPRSKPGEHRLRGRPSRTRRD